MPYFSSRSDLCNFLFSASPSDQLQQLTTQPNGQTRIENEQRLQKQKQAIDMQLSQKAQQLLQMRLVCINRWHWMLVEISNTIIVQLITKIFCKFILLHVLLGFIFMLEAEILSFLKFNVFQKNEIKFHDLISSSFKIIWWILLPNINNKGC